MICCFKLIIRLEYIGFDLPTDSLSSEKRKELTQMDKLLKTKAELGNVHFSESLATKRMDSNDAVSILSTIPFTICFRSL